MSAPLGEAGMRRAGRRMVGLLAGLLVTLAGCAEPAVLRAPPILPDMALPPGTFPVPPVAEPTGDPPITLPSPTRTATPRSDPAARP
ncbi:hypothetical protein [Roseomonas sp. USHLN139]|uniref:hypothetical protein n=1 Tax=Roseomonas sp. USHLN139 TaxID=3081298 RepID=UPI003B027AF8